MTYSVTGMGRRLRALDLSWQTCRPQHPKSDPAAQKAFKKRFWRVLDQTAAEQEGLPNRRVFGVERVARDATGARNRGDPPAQGWHGVAFAGGGQIGADDFRRCRHRLEAVLAAPCLEVGQVGRIGRAIAFRKDPRSLERQALFQPARWNLPRRDAFEPSFCMMFRAMCRRTARLCGPLPSRVRS